MARMEKIRPKATQAEKIGYVPRAQQAKMAQSGLGKSNLKTLNFSILVASYVMSCHVMWSVALDSSGLLLSYPAKSLVSHMIIILISTLF